MEVDGMVGRLFSFRNRGFSTSMLVIVSRTVHSLKQSWWRGWHGPHKDEHEIRIPKQRIVHVTKIVSVSVFINWKNKKHATPERTAVFQWTMMVMVFFLVPACEVRHVPLGGPCLHVSNRPGVSNRVFGGCGPTGSADVAKAGPCDLQKHQTKIQWIKEVGISNNDKQWKIWK